MAPVQPLHRSSRPGKSILKSNGSTNGKRSDAPPKSKSKSLFPNTKVDKRRIKHANLISKVTKPTADTKKRRRRPNKKLVATLDALADALPSASTSDDENGAARPDTREPASQVNIITRKSMKSKPGALKRKQTLDNQERERFARNMAQLQGGTANGGAATATATAPASATQDRWAALRGFIGQTLERRPEVVAGKG